MTIQEYEVEIQVRDKSSGLELTTRTLTLFAYRIEDVALQATVALGSEFDLDRILVKLIRIGPPARLIELASQESANAIRYLMERLSTGLGKTETTKGTRK